MKEGDSLFFGNRLEIRAGVDDECRCVENGAVKNRDEVNQRSDCSVSQVARYWHRRTKIPMNPSGVSEKGGERNSGQPRG